MLGGILFPVADRPSAVATDREGKPAAAAGPRAGEANGGGAVRLVEEQGATVVGEPAVLALVRRGLRPNRSPLDPDSPGQQLAAGGGWACSRFSQVPQGLVAVTLEVPFEPVPLRPLPALGRHPRLFRMPATRPRSGFLRAAPLNRRCSSLVGSSNILESPPDRREAIPGRPAGGSPGLFPPLRPARPR